MTLKSLVYVVLTATLSAATLPGCAATAPQPAQSQEQSQPAQSQEQPRYLEITFRTPYDERKNYGPTITLTGYDKNGNRNLDEEEITFVIAQESLSLEKALELFRSQRRSGGRYYLH